MEIRQKITLSVDRGTMQSYYAKQNDNNTRVLEITLTKDGQPIQIPKSEKATVRYTRADGKGDEADAVVEGNEVIVRLTDEMLALSGTTYLDVALHSGTNILSSSVLSIITGGNPLAAEKITGSSDFLILIETLDRADKSVEDVEALLPKATQAINGANAAKTSAETATAAANAAAKRAEDAAGGVTDKTLSQPDVAADAKAVGDEIDNVKKYAIKNTISGEESFYHSIYAPESDRPETVICFKKDLNLYSMCVPLGSAESYDWQLVESDNDFATGSVVKNIGPVHHVENADEFFLVEKAMKANQGIKIFNYTSGYLRISGADYKFKIAYVKSDKVTTSYTGEINCIIRTFESHPATLELDTTLSQSGKAADAKAVGDKINVVEDNSVIYGITEERIYKSSSQPVQNDNIFVNFTKETNLFSMKIPFDSDTAFDWKIIESEEEFKAGSFVKDVTPVYHVESSLGYFPIKKILKINQAILIFNFIGTLRKIGGDWTREHVGNLDVTTNKINNYYQGEINCTVKLFTPFPSNFNPLKGKKLYIFGDSMSVKMNEPENWASLIAQHNGMELYNNGLMATTIVKGTGGVPGSIYNKICNKESEYYVSDAENADYIVVYGGTNDIGRNATIGSDENPDPETFYGALNAICTTLQNRAPKAKIMFITPYVKYNDSHSPEFPDKCRKYINIIKEVCAKYFIPVFDNSTVSGINYFNPGMVSLLFQPDELHLNFEGQKYVTPKYEAFLKSL